MDRRLSEFDLRDREAVCGVKRSVMYCGASVTRIGRDDAPIPQDITIEGPGIEAEHCLIFNEGGVVTLDPCGHLCSLDGVQVTVPTPLTQGYSLCLGKSYFFRFNHPEEATRMKSMLPQKSPVSALAYNTDNRDSRQTPPSTVTDSEDVFNPKQSAGGAHALGISVPQLCKSVSL
ncbi:pleckstrin homology-like domain family B member 1 [Boleophthalmus pectinirostris]|uniref:pleckstrin homology-like domain family B member 1 n=1 Tax=Boleophthalmus pectinirostris TaxID=150288 RepID=UPI002431354B|nr:pleckstrin homology-like domain family B member 1 [Boleophthalmus pectinirostris]